MYKTICELNEDGNVEKRSCYDDLGDMAWIEVSKYNEDGNQTSIETATVFSQGHFKSTYLYDEKGRMTNIKKFNHNNRLISESNYNYTETITRIEEILTNSKNPTSSVVITYDSDDRLLSKISKDKQGQTLSSKNYVYSYDKHGNWNTKREYTNKKLTYTWERAIEYFN